MKITLHSLFAGFFLLLLAACSGPHFKVEGTIDGAYDQPVMLEKADFTGVWTLVDSTRTSSDGNFSIKADAPEFPDLYRLSFNGRYIYLPVDSIETLTLKASAKDFGRNFTLSGSDQATLMTQFQAKLNAIPKNTPEALDAFKRWVLSNVVLASQGKPTVMAYYALTCRLDNAQLFDMDNPADARVFGAVATAYKQNRPDDPRATALEKMALHAIKKLNKSQGRQKVVKAPESSIIDFELNDPNGNPVRLSSITSNGRPTLLIFSLMGQDNSPEVNRGVNQLFEKYGANVDFIMVSLDNNIAQWRERVRALPWGNVIDPAGTRSLVAANYNIKGLPSFFLFNSKGELLDRAESFADVTRKLPSLN